MARDNFKYFNELFVPFVDVLTFSGLLNIFQSYKRTIFHVCFSHNRIKLLWPNMINLLKVLSFSAMLFSPRFYLNNFWINFFRGAFKMKRISMWRKNLAFSLEYQKSECPVCAQYEFSSCICAKRWLVIGNVYIIIKFKFRVRKELSLVLFHRVSRVKKEIGTFKLLIDAFGNLKSVDKSRMNRVNWIDSNWPNYLCPTRRHVFGFISSFNRKSLNDVATLLESLLELYSFCVVFFFSFKYNHLLIYR